MIILDCEQGTAEWHKARAGVVTASEMNKIYTSTGKASTQAGVYMRTLLMEHIIGGPTESHSNHWMDRGTDMEGEARDAYAFLTDAEVTQVGFVYSDERKLVGCSPDGLVGDDGMVELKCPKASTQIEYMEKPGKVPSSYAVQLQAQLMVTGRAWVDFSPYFPGVRSPVLRVPRDDRFIMGLRAAVETFIAQMLERREGLRHLGYYPKGEE